MTVLPPSPWETAIPEQCCESGKEAEPWSRVLASRVPDRGAAGHGGGRGHVREETGRPFCAQSSRARDLGDGLPAPCFPVGFPSRRCGSHLWQPLQDARGWAWLRTDPLPPPHRGLKDRQFNPDRTGTAASPASVLSLPLCAHEPREGARKVPPGWSCHGGTGTSGSDCATSRDRCRQRQRAERVFWRPVFGAAVGFAVLHQRV